MGYNFTIGNTLLAVILAGTNAFIEEVIFRLFFVTMGQNETNSSTYGILMSSVVFGYVHYGGAMPNGFFGAIISALLGYFLRKSIHETQGFYWAFMIHFLLDVVIMIFLLNGPMY